MNWSSAPTEGAKSLAFQQLSRVTQQLARGATWAQLSEATVVKVIDEVYLRLGFRLTKSKLGQAVPLAGIALGAGLNAMVINRVGQDAILAYRARHLSDKYGVTFGRSAAATADATGVEPLDDGVGAAFDVDRSLVAR